VKFVDLLCLPNSLCGWSSVIQYALHQVGGAAAVNNSAVYQEQ